MDSLLVTGQSGFIGSNLIPELLKNYSVIGLAKKKLSKSNIKQLNQDILRVKLSKIPKDITGIIHLAAIADVNYCEKNPHRCFNVNILGTQKMLEIARKRDSKFLYLSTGHVFGKPKKLPISESHPREPNSIYALSKFGGEIMCEAYSKEYSLDVSIVRLFSIYGPHSPEYLVTSNIISQLIKSNSIKLGNVFPKRDFLYTDDAIAAIKLVLKKMHGFNTYNVGYGKSYSILEICKMLSKITSKKIKINSSKNKIRKNEVNNVVADISKIKKLGWKPTIEIKKGLELTYNWYKTK